MDNQYQFQIGQKARIKHAGKVGKIQGREVQFGRNYYLIRAESWTGWYPENNLEEADECGYMHHQPS